MPLTKTEMDVLNDLDRNGANVPGNISDNTGRHEKSVSRVLSGSDNSLESRNLVRNKGRGVWEITDLGEDVLSEYICDKIESDREG